MTSIIDHHLSTRHNWHTNSLFDAAHEGVICSFVPHALTPSSRHPPHYTRTRKTKPYLNALEPISLDTPALHARPAILDFQLRK